MITAELVNADRVIARINGINPRVMRALGLKMRELSQRLATRVRENLSGAILNSRSGRLRSSIRSETTVTPTSAMGIVYSQGVKYARILEYGGQTRPHMIVATRARALAFQSSARGAVSGQGSTIIVKSVQHPGSKIPEFAYMRKSLAQMRGEILAELRGAVSGATGSMAAE